MSWSNTKRAAADVAMPFQAAPPQAEAQPRVASRWIDGNNFRLLENGEEFFPRVFESIAAARHEVLLETFILFEDKVGKALQAALIEAAKHGAQVDVTIDGYGSPDLSRGFIEALCQAGVRVHVFDPTPRFFGLRTRPLRRMHRKIVVVDGEVAFVGGINYSADHLADFGPEAKQDYSVEIHGPLVAEIRDFCHDALARGQGKAPSEHRWFRRKARAADKQRAGAAQALFVTRDNTEHTNDIERHYRIAIRAARERVVIANAYFFPGYRLIKEMRRAARRGVDVRLILQGEPDMPIVKIAASLLYHHLLNAGVRVYEYTEKPLHGKVALADDAWSTVGSSNLDPLSLALNLEANVIIRDREFNRKLHDNLQGLMRQHCAQIDKADLPPMSGWRLARSYLVFHLLRRYPLWAGWLPTHAPRLKPALDEAELKPACSVAGAEQEQR